MTANCGRIGAALGAFVFLLTASAIAPAQTTHRRPPQSAETTNPSAVDGDEQDVVFLSGRHPVLLRLHIQVDGRGFQLLQRDQLQRVFQAFDSDGSGMLDSDESKTVPVPSQLARPDTTSSPRRELELSEIDRQQPDGSISFDEFAEYVRRFAGTPFTVEAADSSPVDAGPGGLFSKWDADRDGTLVFEELHDGARNLRKYDSNDDELLSLDEMRAFASDAVASSGRPGQASTPFLRLDSSRPTRPVAERLIAQYGDGSARAGLANSVLSIAPDQFARYDADGSGVLEAGELEPLLGAPPIHAAFLIEINRRRLPPVAVTLLSKSENCPVRVEATGGEESAQSMTIGSTRINLEPAYSPVPIYSSRRVESAFQEADQDGNQYLDESELQQLMLPATAFALIDRDGNNQVSADELSAYVALHYRLGRSLTSMYVSGSSLSLFGVLDENSDNRLSGRELAGATGRLKRLDRDRDGRVAADELLTELSVSFRVGQSYLLGASGMPSARRTMQYETEAAADTPEGPVWFGKMDRNRDGDVSLREFLGPLEIFHKLDLNADGLLDADEAASKP